MKKTLLSMICVVALAIAANAQISFAPELGLNAANMTLKSTGNTISTSMKAGLAVGAISDIGFTDHLYLQPGIFYLMNGCNVTDVGTYYINSMQIPVNLEYKLGMTGSTRFYFGIGPYLGYNISDKFKSSDTTATLKIGNDKNKDDIKAIDMGIGLNLGILLSNNFFARIHYQFGFTNLDPGGDADNSTNTSAIGITVGYFFGSAKEEKSKGKKKK